MAIVSFLFTLKNKYLKCFYLLGRSLVIVGFLFAASCTQTPKKTKIDHPQAQPLIPIQTNNQVMTPPSENIIAEAPTSNTSSTATAAAPSSGTAPQDVNRGQAIPKVGLILGPGAAFTYAHIPLLQEIYKQKVPVVGVAGVEWGSVIAAIYSQKAAVNDVEWQMMKIKPESLNTKSLLGGGAKPVDLQSLNEILRSVVPKARAEDAKLPFACASLNLSKNQIYVMTKGAIEQLLPFCIAYPPVSKTWQGNIAAARDTQVLAENLRSRGAQYVVLVNVLPPPNGSKSFVGESSSAASILWSEIASYYNRKPFGVDYVLHVYPQDEDDITNFSRRREIMQKVTSKSAALVGELNRKLGL